MVLWVRTLGSKEIRLGSQVRKQEQANILKWGFSFVVSQIPTWNPEWIHRCLIAILMFSWMPTSSKMASEQCFQNILLKNKRKQIWIRQNKNWKSLPLDNIPKWDSETEMCPAILPLGICSKDTCILMFISSFFFNPHLGGTGWVGFHGISLTDLGERKCLW